MIKIILQNLYMVYAFLLLVILILLAVPFTILLMLLPLKIKNTGMFWLLKAISNAWFFLTGMYPQKFHKNKIDKKHSYVIIPNHSSFIDAGIIYSALFHPFKTLGKVEVEKVPIYNIIYRTVVISVDRSSLKNKAISFRKMLQTLDEGISILIFPEGSFPDTPQDSLLPFQNGAFSLAITKQCELLPILFLDAPARLHPSKINQIYPGPNRIVYLPTISTLNLTKEAVSSLKEYTATYMQACLSFCKNNNIENVWDYAQNWKKSHCIV
ncbi:MAG: lysophospholipid acyltransferase family protein [Chitinophagaceae bacterium]